MYTNGSVYHGTFAQGKLCGEGTYKADTGDVYKGGFKNDLMHGSGVMTFSNGDVYEGEWKRGRFCGRGKITYSFGGYYEGQYLAMARAGATGQRRRFAARHTTIRALAAADAEAEVQAKAAGAPAASGHKGALHALADGKKHGFGKRVWASGAEYVCVCMCVCHFAP